MPTDQQGWDAASSRRIVRDGLCSRWSTASCLPEHCSPWSNGSSGRGKFDQRCDSIYPPPPRSVSPSPNSLFLFMRLPIKPRRDTRHLHLLSISMARGWREGEETKNNTVVIGTHWDPLTRFKLRSDRVERIRDWVSNDRYGWIGISFENL